MTWWGWLIIIWGVVCLGGIGYSCAGAWWDVVNAKELTNKVKHDATEEMILGWILSFFWPVIVLVVAIPDAMKYVVNHFIVVARRRRFPKERLPKKDLRK